MAELTNPLFEDEKEFLERQKLEYERALMGDVEEIKEKTQQASKYVAIGAGILAGAWLLSKAFGGKKDKVLRGGPAPQGLPGKASSRSLRKNRQALSGFAADDLGFSTGHHADRGQQPTHHERAQLAPDVYHAMPLASSDDDASHDPFQPVSATAPSSYAPARQAAYAPHEPAPAAASSIVADTFRAFMQSDTGKMLVAQASALLMGIVAKKVHEYLPMLKNPDLATSPAEPETRDIDFTYHHDDANAPHQPL
ncbi:hypothetical protein [Hymenobacter yonginensis]|uniref:Uncharacterized protein n=1 Tax=Hymenobacter yonginensis TaxID=748197 RepID=A0ABY7PQ48_9BACT|nr:hypothetical protein [Hymenobacter yonginensis]WBO84165.1 hypothetical protein O9Z63_17530 [Hymenobacter yonginensis]